MRRRLPFEQLETLDKESVDVGSTCGDRGQGRGIAKVKAFSMLRDCVMTPSLVSELTSKVVS